MSFLSFLFNFRLIVGNIGYVPFTLLLLLLFFYFLCRFNIFFILVLHSVQFLFLVSNDSVST